MIWKFRFQVGQTLVELLVALGIAAVVVVAMIALASTSLANITFSRLQGESNRLARTTMEWLRSERDTDWDTFASRVGTWCMPTLSWTIGTACTSGNPIPDTDFFREVVLGQISADKIEASVRVYWTDSKGTHETRLNSRLTMWK